MDKMISSNIITYPRQDVLNVAADNVNMVGGYGNIIRIGGNRDVKIFTAYQQ